MSDPVEVTVEFEEPELTSLTEPYTVRLATVPHNGDTVLLDGIAYEVSHVIWAFPEGTVRLGLRKHVERMS